MFLNSFHPCCLFQSAVVFPSQRFHHVARLICDILCAHNTVCEMSLFSCRLKITMRVMVGMKNPFVVQAVIES